METVNIKAEDLKKLINDVEQIKEILLSEREEIEETELTDWAKEQLETARKTPHSEYISHEDVKKRILSRNLLFSSFN